jgi:hypothetical protein
MIPDVGCWILDADASGIAGDSRDLWGFFKDKTVL